MKISDAYNSWAEQYDTNENKTRDLDKKAVRETLSKFSFESVLELGCGTGKNTEWLIEKSKRIISVDFSDEMLKIAKSKIADNKVSFIKADITKDWEIENNFADLITFSLVLEHIQNLDHIFLQSNLKLKENGLVFISELHPIKQYLGSKARFETDKGTETLEVYTHHVTEYIKNAQKNKFELIELNEWFDDEQGEGIPRLITFVFRKS